MRVSLLFFLFLFGICFGQKEEIKPWSMPSIEDVKAAHPGWTMTSSEAPSRKQLAVHHELTLHAVLQDAIKNQPPSKRSKTTDLVERFKGWRGWSLADQDAFREVIELEIELGDRDPRSRDSLN